MAGEIGDLISFGDAVDVTLNNQVTAHARRSPDLRRVILSEIQYYRASPQIPNYGRNEFFQGPERTGHEPPETAEICKPGEADSNTPMRDDNDRDKPPPLPPKRHGKTKLMATASTSSISSQQNGDSLSVINANLEQTVQLSQSAPDAVNSFDPFSSEASNSLMRGSEMPTVKPGRSSTNLDYSIQLEAKDLLQFKIDEYEDKDGGNATPSNEKTNNDTSFPPVHRLSLRRKVRTLSPQDLMGFERGTTTAKDLLPDDKARTLPLRPPPPKNNRFSCPPAVITTEQNKDGSSGHDAASDQPQTQDPDIFFQSGLFQKTEERNEEAVAFCNSIAKLRKLYKHTDKDTNTGYVSASKIKNKALLGTTCDVTIYFDPEPDAKQITCLLSRTPTELIHQFLSEFYNGSPSYELDIIAEQYTLKFVGATTFLVNDCALCDYVKVQECIKYGYKIELVLVRTGFVNTDFKRDEEDDREDGQGTYFNSFFEERSDASFSISEQGLSVLLETYNNEASRLLQDISVTHKVTYMPERIIQVVKAISKSLAQVELLSIQDGVNLLLSLKPFAQQTKTLREAGARKNFNEYLNPIHFDQARFHVALQKLTLGVHSLIELYCKAFHTQFKIQNPKSMKIDNSDIYERIDPRTIDDRFTVRIGSIHRMSPSWKQEYVEFEIEVALYYGGHLISRPQKTSKARIVVGFFEHIRFHELLEFNLPVRNVPREAKVTFKLIGLSPPKKGSDGKTTLGWVSSNVYDYQGFLLAGSRLFGLLSETEFNPVATCATGYIQRAETVILKADFQLYHTEVLFPQPVLVTSSSVNGTHPLTETETEFSKKMIRKDSLMLTEEERVVVWKCRYALCHLPHALKHVLTSCPSWDSVNVIEVHAILSSWDALSPVEAIEFLQADFPDKTIRETAVLWLSNIGDDDLVDYLIELVQAIKYEAYHDSALAQFLIKRSLTSQRVAHFLFWHLKYYTGDLQFCQRFQIVLSGLLSACGRRLRNQLQQQDNLIVQLTSVSMKIKQCKDANRQYFLVKELHKVNESNTEFPVRSPIDPSLKLGSVLPEQCSYFSSNTVPLKVALKNVEVRGRDVDFIFKIGDDLRKDLVTLLMFRVMNKLWLNEGLDLKMMLYNVLPTGPLSGLIEIIPNAATFREIHIQYGLTGSFKDDSLILWLQKFNISEADYHGAIDNFTCSAAGYCVATYLLGIGDRHNDNIMLTKNGHLFHIDFSKFMGDVQKFGSISRDRVPFVLTPDMAYVINNGLTPTPNFQRFIEHCCIAFNILRRNKHVILNLLGLMVYSGISYLSEKEDLLFIRRNLQLHLTDEEATMYFTRLIESSLSSRSTQLNFFIHNLAHMKNLSEATLGSSKSSPYFSFSNQTHTSEEEANIDSARIVDFQKRYLPEKHYVFVINVTRAGSEKGPKFVFRRYEDFQELHAKLSYLFNTFTGVVLPELPAKILLGRSQIREVAHRRRHELDQYLVSLSESDDVWHSDIVYTFLHSYIKDTEEARRFADYVELLAEGPKSRIGGKIKLSIGYKNQALNILVMHCSGLIPNRLQGLADPFVKLKVLPDPLNYYKRKTRICRKTLNPTFNETLSFDVAWELLQRRVLQITVWDSNNIMEKEFLGGLNCYLSTFDVKKTQSNWYPLTDIQI